jgi:hypothetical protein
MSFKEVRAEKQGLLDDIQQVLVVLARTDISDELRLAFTRSLLLFRKILSQLNELLRRMVRISIAQRQASIDRAILRRLNYLGYVYETT